MILPSPFLPDARTVKARADFFAIASRYMRLRRAGRQYVGLCPFHSERHPSCYVHPHKNIFYCFGCGRGGDVFDFVMLAESCDFLEALRIVNEFSEGGGPRERAERASGFERPEGAKSPALRSRASLIARNPARRFSPAWMRQIVVSVQSRLRIAGRASRTARRSVLGLSRKRDAATISLRKQNNCVENHSNSERTTLA